MILSEIFEEVELSKEGAKLLKLFGGPLLWMSTKSMANELLQTLFVWRFIVMESEFFDYSWILKNCCASLI